ncbi:hypothetical protein G6F40_014951 [Rhizopus arrhizus]|nr:hypothetical protein G6F40_014951 [Rhizopus arrhizus]
MAFSLYQSMRTVPAELNEAARIFRLSGWQRFWRLELPYATPGLLWNMMMSMSGGWFFLVAAEAISVAGQDIKLPGIGSYIAVAIHAADGRAPAEALERLGPARAHRVGGVAPQKLAVVGRFDLFDEVEPLDRGAVLRVRLSSLSRNDFHLAYSTVSNTLARSRGLPRSVNVSRPNMPSPAAEMNGACAAAATCDIC